MLTPVKRHSRCSLAWRSVTAGDQVEAVQRGEVTPDEIDATVSTLINRNEMLEDDPAALAEVDFRWRLHGKDLDLDDLKARIRRVTRDDIARAASRLELDTVYTLTAGPSSSR